MVVFQRLRADGFRKQRFFIGLLGLGCAISLVGLQSQGIAKDVSRSPISRLNAQLKKMPQLYLPFELKLGEPNRFFIQGPAGKKATLYLSNSGEGFETTNGLDLRVGTENTTLEGVIPNKGVLEMVVDMPEDEDLAGSTVYVDAILWSTDDGSDAEHVQLVDSSGRRTGLNQVAITKPSKGGGGPTIMPTMPGMGADFMRNINNFAEATDASDRKKELLDYGNRDTSTQLDRNSFTGRSGGLQDY